MAHHHDQREPELFRDDFTDPSFAPVAAPAPQAADQHAYPPLRAADDLPEPAYQPQLHAPSLEAEYQEPEAVDEREEFVAPQGAKPGQPSQHTMQRLQAAVAKAPRAQPESQQPQFFSDDSVDDKPKGFRLNSLISRMTGSGDSGAAAGHVPPHQPTQHDGGETSPTSEHHEQAAQEQIEIPAFLGRQAN